MDWELAPGKIGLSVDGHGVIQICLIDNSMAGVGARYTCASFLFPPLSRQGGGFY